MPGLPVAQEAVKVTACKKCANYSTFHSYFQLVSQPYFFLEDCRLVVTTFILQDIFEKALLAFFSRFLMMYSYWPCSAIFFFYDVAF